MGSTIQTAEGEKNPNERTRIDGKIYTRERIRRAKGDGVSYDEYINWLLDEAAEKYGTDEAPVVERRGNTLLVRPGESGEV